MERFDSIKDIYVLEQSLIVFYAWFFNEFSNFRYQKELQKLVRKLLGLHSSSLVSWGITFETIYQCLLKF